jgi:hypothetical protein
MELEGYGRAARWRIALTIYASHIARFKSRARRERFADAILHDFRWEYRPATMPCAKME